jgi:hypothetical protein
MSFWWSVDVRAVTEGDLAGTPYDDTATHLNPAAFTNLNESSAPSRQFVVGNEAFGQMKTESRLEGIAGSRFNNQGTQIVHVIAVIDADGQLDFLGPCPERLELPIREMAAANHPSATEIEVLIEAATSNDFSELADWNR